MKIASVEATRTLKRKTPELRTATENKPERITSEGSHILKLKKEAVAADGLWRALMSDGPRGMHRWLEKLEETGRPNKRKKVVKTELTPRYIEFLRARPARLFTEISAEKLSSKSERFRREYLARKYIDGKWADYRNALIEQYDLWGHAEDEDEFTDDEDDDVVKMKSLAIH